MTGRTGPLLQKIFCLSIALLLLAPPFAFGQAVHENPNALTPSRGQDINDQADALIEKMLGSLNGISIALDDNNITAAKYAYGSFSTSFTKYGDLLWQLNLTDADYAALAEQMNLTNDQIRSLIDDYAVYNNSTYNYNLSISSGDTAGASANATLIQSSYNNLSYSYAGLRRNATYLDRILGDRGIDTGDLSSSLGSLDMYMGHINSTYRGLGFARNASKLALTTDRTQLSVGDTLTAYVALNDANGTPISGGNVRVYVDDRLAGTAVTDSSGQGSVRYTIPVVLSSDHVLARAEYMSAPGPIVDSNYVELTIENVPATLTLGIDRSDVIYGNIVNMTGTLAAGGTPVPGRKIGLQLNGSPLANVTTDGNGSYTYQLFIGPTIPAGQLYPVAVFAGGDNDLLLNASTPATQSLDVSALPTQLTITGAGNHYSGSPVQVTGNLVAVNGVPVSGVNVSVFMDGMLIDNATTSDTGIYSVILPNPYNASSSNHTLFAIFDPGPGTCLNASASAVVGVTFLAGSNAPGISLDTLIATSILLLLLAVIAYLAFIWYARNRPKPELAVPEVSIPVPARPEPEPEPLNVEEESASILSLGEANARDAMARTYAAAKKVLSRRGVKLDESMTHQEVYRAAASQLSQASPSLKIIVDLYEKAIFANITLTGSELGAAVQCLKELAR